MALWICWRTVCGGAVARDGQLAVALRLGLALLFGFLFLALLLCHLPISFAAAIKRSCDRPITNQTGITGSLKRGRANRRQRFFATVHHVRVAAGYAFV